MELLPYETHACTMCGYQAPVASESAKFKLCDPDYDGGCGNGITVAHLHRTCVRCGYVWRTVTSNGIQPLPPTPEQMAMAAVRTVAAELNAAATSLEEAAQSFKDGKATPMAANRAKGAASRARQAVAGLLGQ